MGQAVKRVPPPRGAFERSTCHCKGLLMYRMSHLHAHMGGITTVVLSKYSVHKSPQCHRQTRWGPSIRHASAIAPAGVLRDAQVCIRFRQPSRLWGRACPRPERSRSRGSAGGARPCVRSRASSRPARKSRPRVRSCVRSRAFYSSMITVIISIYRSIVNRSFPARLPDRTTGPRPRTGVRTV